MSFDLDFHPVPGFLGYAVNRVGQVRGKYGRVLASGPNPGGYPSCSLWKGSKQLTRMVHQLVLLTFVGPHPERHECNHVDGDKTNNRVENLEWVTRSQNILHTFRVLGHKNPRRKLTDEQVLEVRENVEGALSLSRRFGVNVRTIYRVRSVGSYRWVKIKSQGPIPSDGALNMDP